MPTRGKHDAVVSCHDPVAAESRHVHAIVEPLPSTMKSPQSVFSKGSVIRPFASGHT